MDPHGVFHIARTPFQALFVSGHSPVVFLPRSTPVRLGFAGPKITILELLDRHGGSYTQHQVVPTRMAFSAGHTM